MQSGKLAALIEAKKLKLAGLQRDLREEVSWPAGWFWHVRHPILLSYSVLGWFLSSGVVSKPGSLVSKVVARKAPSRCANYKA